VTMARSNSRYSGRMARRGSRFRVQPTLPQPVKPRWTFRRVSTDLTIRDSHRGLCVGNRIQPERKTMSIIVHDNKTHLNTCNLAESARQAAFLRRVAIVPRSIRQRPPTALRRRQREASRMLLTPRTLAEALLSAFALLPALIVSL
jgi:hypothetical protein